jgi:hypothetical protein
MSNNSSYIYRQFPESTFIKSISLRSGEDRTGLSTLHVKMRSTGNVYEYRVGDRRLDAFINETFWGGDVGKAFRRHIAGQVKSRRLNDE